MKSRINSAALDCSSENPGEIRGLQQATRLANFTLWAVVVAAVALVISALGAGLLYATLIETQKTTSEVRRQANAAEAQNKVAEDAEHRQLRAYIVPVPDGATIVDVIEGKRVIVALWIKNFGQTPGQHAQVTGMILVLPFSDAEIYTPLDTNNVGRAVTEYKTIVPNYVYGSLIPSTGGPNSAQIEAIRSGNGVIVAYGTLSYCDIFNVEQHSNFCFCFNSVEPRAPGALCRNHNDSD